MEQKKWDMHSLSDELLQAVRKYGIKEVSIEQYEIVCNKIIRFSLEQGFNTYYQELKAEYDAFIDSKIDDKSICYEYGRFQHRVIRMMCSLAETGKTDFSGFYHNHKNMLFRRHLRILSKKCLIITY